MDTDLIDPIILTGQGLPDSNPFKSEDEDDSDEEGTETIVKKSKLTKKDLDKADYVAELENMDDDFDSDSGSDDNELYL